MTLPESNQVNLVSCASLPPAAKRWLERALPQHRDLPSSVRIEQEGTMDIRGGSNPFTASGIHQASPLSFNWRARFQMLPGVWIVAEDGHRDGQGWGSARLWGIIPMGKRTGPEVLTSQLVRNLGELPWLPTFALADPALTWTSAGETAFEVRTSAGDREVMVRFKVDDQGDIVRAYSPSRPYEVAGGFAQAPWYSEFSNHREFGGVWIPATAVATFEKDDGPWEYFRGRITSVSFGTDPV
jgi:hypothetical protein